jgi:ParB family chromosome partitioning protein
MPIETWPITRISIGERYREEVGDIEGLAKSIAEIGLLHPLVVVPDGTLIAGLRRLEAMKQLGRTEVPVNVVGALEDARLALLAERDENTCREDLLPSEAARLGAALEALERPAAKEREKVGKKVGPSGKFPQGQKGRVRDAVGDALGVSGRTYEKLKEVVEAAKEEPEKFGPVVEEMDRTGKVEPAFRKVRELKAGTKAPEGPSPKERLRRAKQMSPDFKNAFDDFLSEVEAAWADKFQKTSREAVLACTALAYAIARRPLKGGRTQP